MQARDKSKEKGNCQDTVYYLCWFYKRERKIGWFQNCFKNECQYGEGKAEIKNGIVEEEIRQRRNWDYWWCILNRKEFSRGGREIKKEIIIKTNGSIKFGSLRFA